MLFSKTLTFLALAIGSVAAAPVELAKRSSSGWNDFNCKPTAAHPYPLILIHGLYGSSDNWSYMAPRFVAKGYCVFSLTYGALLGNTLNAGVAAMETSAAQLGTFVDKVLASTGASKVDFVGHSQGTLMPRYYLKFLGGAAKVHKYGGFGSIVRGTTVGGIAAISGALGIQTNIPGCAACGQLLVGSDLIKKVNADGEAVSGVEIMFISTRYDELVTPYTNGQFLQATATTKNKILQNLCITDVSAHITMLYDPIVFNALHAFFTPSASQLITCFSL